MTSLPAAPARKRLGLVIDLDICVGCHACAVNCKEWNTGGVAAPLTDLAPYGAKPDGVWFNRVHTYEVGEGAAGRTVHFPRSCLHCAEPACVTVCPTGASFKRADVLSALRAAVETYNKATGASYRVPEGFEPAIYEVEDAA